MPGAGAAQEKSYSLPQAVVDVQIASDGSLLVREDITFSFSGSFSGAYRDIPVRRGERVDLVSVSEGGRRYQPGGNTALGSFDQPAGTASSANTQRVRVVWHYRAFNERRGFTIRYRFRGLAVAYDDVVDVNLQVWGDEWPVAVDDLQRGDGAAAADRAPGHALPGLGRPGVGERHRRPRRGPGRRSAP